MECRNCKRPDAWQVRTSIEEGVFIDACNFCGGFGTPGLEYADVYFPGPHACQNITDDTGTPIQFHSKSHKARVMREKGIGEIGDRVGGSNALPRPSGRTWYEQRRSQGKIR